METREQHFSKDFELYITRLLLEAETACAIPADGWPEKRTAILHALERTLGSDLPREWPPLSPCTESVRQRDGFCVEQVSAEFWPGIRCPLQVYVPQGEGPFPAVVMVGTGPFGPRHALYQQLGGALATMGILTVGTLALGKGARDTENCAYPYNSIALLTGTSIAQEQFHTGRRALDYLLSRDDTDASRVGITGDSDGGWVSLWVATKDPRITAAAPACTNYTFGNILLDHYPWQELSAAEGNPPEVLAHAANIPMMTACNAPKWFRFLNAYRERRRLHMIPLIDGAARAAYAHAEVPERYGSHLADCEHGYWPEIQVEAVEWFCEVFFGERPPAGTLTTVPALPGTKFHRLAVNGNPVEIYPEDTTECAAMQVGDLPDDPGKAAFWEIIETRRHDAAGFRREHTAHMNEAQLCSELRCCLGIDRLALQPTAAADGEHLCIETEPGLYVKTRWVQPPCAVGDTVRLIVGSAVDRQAYTAGDTARIDLPLREDEGLGEPLWALVMLNRPPLGMWVWDALCTARQLSRDGFGTIELTGVGEAGSLVAVFAGVLSADVTKVRTSPSEPVSLDTIVADRPTTCRYWAHRLLWTADTPELVHLLRQQGRWVDER